MLNLNSVTRLLVYSTSSFPFIDTTDVQLIFHNVIIKNKLNITCVFIQNSPAAGCRVVINGMEHNITRLNSATNASATGTFPLGEEGSHSISVYDIEIDGQWNLFRTFEIFTLVSINPTSNGTGDICKLIAYF